MLSLNITEPSSSSYCSPVVPVKKPNSIWCVCIDNRKLNDLTIFDAEPIPSISDSLHEFSESKYFTELDLCKGYWQVPVADDSKEYTAFATKHGLMQFKMMPFGLKTAPATFIWLMCKALTGLPKTRCYFDNIVVHSSDWTSHLTNLKNALTRLGEHGLTASPSKCFFAFESIKYLGFSLGMNTLSPIRW